LQLRIHAAIFKIIPSGAITPAITFILPELGNSTTNNIDVTIKIMLMM